ncbi:MAG: DMT family transporter [Treponema sp.]|jgi:drug/metabolite transporter (DMT)-like permease|nr:DMT family transporter [Treponema sp.]
MTERHKALAAIISCVLFWGFSFISIKVSVAVFPPMSLGLLRFAIALIFLFFIKQKLAPQEKLRLRDIPLLFGAGLSGVTLYFFFENNGVSLVTASEASIAIGAIPVLTMIADWLSGKITHNRDSAAHRAPRIGIRQWLGAFISIGGVWLVAGVSLALSGSVLGYIYMAGAALSWVTYSLLTRPLFARCSRIYIVFWQSLAGFICFIPFSILELGRWGTPDLPVILHVVFLGICCSALGYWFYARSLEVLGISVSAIFINLVPVITVTGGFFVMGDRLSPLQWLGAALVISGVYLSMWKQGNANPK